MPRIVCRALISYFLDCDDPCMAFLLGLGFHTYLRTGEILKLAVKDVQLTPQHGVVTIRSTKTGIRFNIDESVAINDLSLYSLWELCHLERALAPNDLVWDRSAATFRSQFYKATSFPDP